MSDLETEERYGLAYWDLIFEPAEALPVPLPPLTDAVPDDQLIDGELTLRLPCTGRLILEFDAQSDDEFEGPHDEIIRHTCPDCGLVHRNTRSNFLPTPPPGLDLGDMFAERPVAL